MPSFTAPRRTTLTIRSLTAGLAAALLCTSALAAQTRPAQETPTFTPAQVRAATNALDAHVSAHPKSKASAASAKKVSATGAATDAQRARALRTPVPALKSPQKVKKAS